MGEINVLLFWTQVHPVQFFYIYFLIIFLVGSTNYDTSCISIGSYTVSFNRITKITYSPLNIGFCDSFHNIWRIGVFFYSHIERLNYRLGITNFYFPLSCFTKSSSSFPSPPYKDICLNIVLFSHFILITEFVMHFSFTILYQGSFLSTL
uniref:Uncharacterized protein n=1 Tax=Panstrongylus lignarius TaxID=156445 RepID=A0A224XVN5_9HEMI